MATAPKNIAATLKKPTESSGDQKLSEFFLFEIIAMLLDILLQFCKLFKCPHLTTECCFSTKINIATSAHYNKQNVKLLTSSAKAIIIQYEGPGELSTNIVTVQSNYEQYVEIDFWTTPLQHYNEEPLRKNLLTKRKPKRFDGACRRLEF